MLQLTSVERGYCIYCNLFLLFS